MTYTFSLERAAELAVSNGSTLHEIKVARWAETYNATTDQVRIAFEKAQAGRVKK